MLGPGCVGEEQVGSAGGGVGRFVQVDEREHLATDGLVPGPVDEVRAPLHRLGDVRQCEQIRAQAFSIHGDKVQGEGCKVQGAL